MIRFFSALALGFAMLASVGVAQAQFPAAPAIPNPVQKVLVLKGTEDLANFNELTFTINGDVVEMIDASQRPINGAASIARLYY